MDCLGVNAVVLDLEDGLFDGGFEEVDALEFDGQPHVVGELGVGEKGVEGLVGLDVEEVAAEEKVGADLVHHDLVAETSFVGEEFDLDVFFDVGDVVLVVVLHRCDFLVQSSEGFQDLLLPLVL